MFVWRFQCIVGFGMRNEKATHSGRMGNIKKLIKKVQIHKCHFSEEHREEMIEHGKFKRSKESRD